MPPKLIEQLEEIDLYPDRADRIEMLIAIGEEFQNPSQDEFPRNDSCRVPGCESEAFVAMDRDGHLKIAIDNPQGISAMAMAQIILQGFSGATPEQVRLVPEEIVYRVFGRELSMGKSMGLTGMVGMAKRAFLEPA
jgi:cysteine desulfuration protein SufE